MPRAIAFDIINTTLQSHQPFDAAFNKHPRVNKLEPRDRNLAYNIVITALRHLGQIDDIIDHCLTKGLPPHAKFARTILRIGICQLLFLNTPAHAAVDTSVQLAAQQRQGIYKKLINAILRRVAREGTKLLKYQDAERLNTPDWLWNSWITAYGEETTRNIAKAHLKIPALDLWVKSEPKLWAQKLGGQILPTGGVRLPSATNVAGLDGFKEGAWWVQDAAASLPVQLFGDNLKEKRIADICAAPGGKTAQLILAGAEVIAVDRSEKRLKILTENLKRLSFSPEIVCEDAVIWQPNTLVDGVLIDAPCSATGTIRRHPDIKYLKNNKVILQTQQVQLRLLEAATKMIKPDGQIVFSTCSLQPEEGPKVIDSFLSEHSNWQRKSIPPKLKQNHNEFITSAGDIRTFPFHLSNYDNQEHTQNHKNTGGMDGFFSTCLIRK
jgi:16S rRNA (cytosine967-C5)-methyltransferase